jgi:4-deoxy-L-threo-5-hexosulose-uronate ketol-isomerase
MKTDKRHASHPDMVVGMSTQKLRDLYLVSEIFAADELCLTLSHIERMVIGGAMPVAGEIVLEEAPAFTLGRFLDQRELGIINIGGAGTVEVDGEVHTMSTRDGMYVPRGTQRVVFRSTDSTQPAKFYLASTPAHAVHPLVKISIDQAKPNPMGSPATSNERVIYQYINPDVCKSCNLLLGLTALKEGSVWNTMPCHRHERRSEVYFYFDMKPDTRLFHFMGEPNETRHIVVSNEQAVISPPWSIHSGCGTANYTFIWAMGGENVDYRDMAPVPVDTLR